MPLYHPPLLYVDPQRWYTTNWYALVAQWIEQRTSKPKVVGSIPTRGTIFSHYTKVIGNYTDFSQNIQLGSRRFSMILPG